MARKLSLDDALHQNSVRINLKTHLCRLCGLARRGNKPYRWALARAMPIHYSLRRPQSQVNQYTTVEEGYVAGGTSEGGKAGRANHSLRGWAAQIGPAGLPPRDVQTCKEGLGRLWKRFRSASAERIAQRGSVSLGGWAEVPQQRSERSKYDPTARRLLIIHRFRQTAPRFLKYRSTPWEDQEVFKGILFAARVPQSS